MFRRCCLLAACLASAGWVTTACHSPGGRYQASSYYSYDVVHGYAARGHRQPAVNYHIGVLKAQVKQNNAGRNNRWNQPNNRWSKIEAAKSIARMGAAGAPAVGALLEHLGDNDKALSQACLHALGRIGEPAIPSLVQELENEQKNVRWRAAVGLAAVWSSGDPAHVRASMARPRIRKANVEAAVEGLTKALFSVDTQLRCSAAFGLGVIGPDAGSAVEALAGVATDPDEKVAKQAIIALGRIGKAAARESGVVAGRMQEPEAELGEHLAELHDPEVAERLRYHVAMSLIGMHSQEPFWIPLTSGLVEGATHSRNAGRSEWHGYSVPRIARELKGNANWQVRKAAAMALGEVGHSYPSGRWALQQAVDDPDPRVREAVQEALRREISPGRQF